MKFRPVLLLLAALLALAALPASAQTFSGAQRAEIVAIVREALKSDPSILRDAVAAVAADDELKQEAAARTAIAAAGKELSADPSDPTAGNPSGDVTIVEFFDLRCPYCRRLEPTMDEFLRRDHGVRLVLKDLPILGPASVLGTKAILAARLQEPKVENAYLRLREALMRGAPDITQESVDAAAKGIGLNLDRLHRDMENPEIKARIDANLKLARNLDIQGTPALIIGKELIPGAVDIAELQQAVARARSAHD